LVACAGRETVKTDGAVFDISPEILDARADTLIELGRIREGEIVQFDARIRNVGTEPLVIKSVDTSCGCTSVEYEKRPIAPNETGQFSFRFDSRGFWGTQLKLIELDTSVSQYPFQVMVRAEIEYPDFLQLTE
jgi:hypothetical protein